MHRPAPAAALSALLLAAAPAWGAPASTGAAGAATDPAAATLVAALDDLVLNGPLAEARAGVCVVSLDSGATLYARGADLLLNPASNVKLFTAAAALARLGPEHRFETELSVDAASAGLPGGAARTLHLRGKGDPSLTTERLDALAADLLHLGLRRVGDLTLDDGWFDGVRTGPGFDQEAGDKAYLAPTGALSLNLNTVAVHVGPGERPGVPGRVELEPDSAHLELVNRTTTAGPRAARRLVIASTPLPDGRQRVVVEGRLPAGGRTSVTWRRIDDPARYLGETLRRALERRGIKVSGRVRLGSVPPDARLLHVAESEPLGEIVRRLQKTSNNFIAEQLLKAMGAATSGPPGSWAGGVAAVEAFLAEVGIPRGAYVMKNGSGLNDANRFSARQTVQLLTAMWRRFPIAAEFLAALPMAGKDGTIRTRMEGTDAAGQVRAKTGTLEGVTALSGYVETAVHERLAFAIIVNDHGRRAGPVVQRVDQLAAVLAARGKAAAPPAPVAAAGPAGPGAAEGAPAAGERAQALDATLRTYLAMGRAADRRNLPFLRTALQAEAAPAVRLAVAEALYRSSPDSGSVQRALLEAAAAAPGAAPLLPLLAAADPADPVPVLAGLGDLAAGESAEALGLLVALAAPAAEAPPLGAALASILADLAEVVPAALRAAVAAASPEARAATAALLGDRLPGLAGPAAEAPAIGPAAEPGAAAPGR